MQEIQHVLNQHERKLQTLFNLIQAYAWLPNLLIAELSQNPGPLERHKLAERIRTELDTLPPALKTPEAVKILGMYADWLDAASLESPRVLH